MKVLLVNKFFFLNGGSETVYFQEREFLQNNNIKVLDFSMVDNRNLSSKYSDYFVPNVNYSRSEKSGFLSKSSEKVTTAIRFVRNGNALNKLSALIKKEKPDIAHLHNIYHQLTPAIIPLLKKSGIKVVLTLHDSKLVCPNHTMLNDGAICNSCEGKRFIHSTINRCQDGSLFRSLLLTIEAYWHKKAGSYENVDLFLAPSQFFRDLIVKYRMGREKVRVLHNGIDTKRYEYSKNDNGYGVFFGRISKEKGVQTLLKAYFLLKNKMGLKIIGTGPELETLQKQYPGVEFTGYKTGEELKNIIKNSGFVIVPSEWYENCSMSVLEAMAYGKPVIGSRIGGIPEQIDDLETGLLFEMGNVQELAIKMNLLADDNILRRKMGEAARKKLEQKYSLDVHCSKLLDVYRELLVNK